MLRSVSSDDVASRRVDGQSDNEKDVTGWWHRTKEEMGIIV